MSSRKYSILYIAGIALISILPKSVDAQMENMDGLVCYFRGDSLNDSSGFGNTVTAVNGAVNYETVPSSPFSSTPRNVFKLDGSGYKHNHLQSSVSNLPLGDSPRSMMGWVRFDSNTINFSSPFAYGGNYGDCQSFDFVVTQKRLDIDVWGNNCQETNNGVITHDFGQIGVWNHYAITYENLSGGRNLLVYVNGILTYQGTVNRVLETVNSDFLFGRRTTDDNNRIWAAVAEVAVFNRALTENDIKAVVSGSISSIPSTSPSSLPSTEPTIFPSFAPSVSSIPSTSPSSLPSVEPTIFPSFAPSVSSIPSTSPSALPSIHPSNFPSSEPSLLPSFAPTTSDSAGGGGDPHFFGFGDMFFTWQGHCDIILLQTPRVRDGETYLELHARTKKVRTWSTIEAIAIKVDEDIIEIESHKGKLVFNGNEVEAAQIIPLTVVKSIIKSFPNLGKVLLYEFSFDKEKHLEVTVNTRTQMVYISLSGAYPHTEGILGSSHNPGLFARDGTNMLNKDINKFVETWQVRDDDNQLFHQTRIPQYPSKCLYDIKKIKKVSRARHLKETHSTTKEEAVAACAVHPSGDLQEFCIEDVLRTGDIDSASDSFYG